ncbi:MAG: fructose-1,6-bisphosphatase [Lachnospiraceae bacterium]|nr:fructose-1,6-bisphosphatase [Lachnospiraceae bacterium]MBQ8948023.1 fructose-1,6-bisphosphatase [Lachnospiraceae bacterium]
MDDIELTFLKSLAKQYPNTAAASTEIINLQAILNLPKSTEHFLTDIHGEYESFNHVLKNGSGSVRRKIDEEFGLNLSDKDKRSLATLIYYPREKLDIVQETEENIDDWYRITLHRLVQVTKRVSSKYTRSKVRRALPGEFAYVIEELITEKAEIQNKEAYYNEIIHSIIRVGVAPDFIVALCNLIQRMVIDHLHIVGDIFDRGPGPDIIMDTLMAYHSVDVQWGNHDMVWMGAAAGCDACIANVIRFSARYGNLSLLEESYGINLIPLATFAMAVYGNSDTGVFKVKYDEKYDKSNLELDEKMHKAISIIQFKLEGALIKKNPEFHMDDRLLLDRIDHENGRIELYGKWYELRDKFLPTIDPADPYALSPEEEDVVKKLRQAFVRCDKLQKHVRFLFSKGSLYKIHNSNLLYHGCVPLDDEGQFKKVTLKGKEYYGRALYDKLEYYARKGYYSDDPDEREYGRNIMWYIWTGPNSPVFGKDKMTTFERYFIEDKETHTEKKCSYYRLLDDDTVVDRILVEFGLQPGYARIVNGHVPVEVKKGASPIRCGGKVLVIDGGFSKAYQAKTGIAGYTLVSNSHGMRLVAHKPFQSAENAVTTEADMFSDEITVEVYPMRHRVADTDIGADIRDQISQLEELLKAFREGLIPEKD